MAGSNGNGLSRGAQEGSITLSFPCRLLQGDSGLSYLTGEDCSEVRAVYARSAASAREGLRNALKAHIADAFHALANTGQAMIGCTDGTVILVQYRHGSWGYSIGGPGRAWMSGVMGGDDDFRVTCDRAQKHAADSFGGVAWSIGLLSSVREGGVA